MTLHDVTANIEPLLTLVSPKVGLIRSLSQPSKGVEEPTPPIIYQAILSHFDFQRAELIYRLGAGKGETQSEAIGGAIGEALERYCASQFHPEAILKAPFMELKPRAIHPADCVLYSESQYARSGFVYHRFDEQVDTAWVRACELPGQQEIWVPASFVYLNYPHERFEDVLCIATSNGLAAGPSLESAILSGLCELIERDAFLITWLNKLPAPRIDFSSLTGLPLHIRTHYNRFGIETYVFNVTTDIPVYVMMGIAIDRSEKGPAAVVGLGCHLDPQVALRKALLEICQVRPGQTMKYHQELPQRRIRSFQDVGGLEDHSALFSMPELLGEFDFLLKSSETQSFEQLPNLSSGELRADLDACVDGLTEIGSRVAYADITTPDIVPLGVRVVRTFSTGLQPIHFGYGEERLGGRRLYEVPRILGYSSEARTESELNPCPHPLA